MHVDLLNWIIAQTFRNGVEIGCCKFKCDDKVALIRSNNFSSLRLSLSLSCEQSENYYENLELWNFLYQDLMLDDDYYNNKKRLSK